MAYDEVSFLNGIILGKAMKGVSMANPNRGDLLRVQSGRLTAVRRILRDPVLPGELGGSPQADSFALRIHGEVVQASASISGDFGIGSLLAAGTLTESSEHFYAAVTAAGELTDSVVAALRQKAADRNLLAPGMPEGLGGTLLASVTIINDE